jgi:hypothetical protein
MAFDKATIATITLDYPFDFDGEKITSLEMRRPKVRDNLKASKAGNDFESLLVLLANLVQRPVEMFDGMDEIDFTKLQEQYAAFTGRQAQTTPTN